MDDTPKPKTSERPGDPDADLNLFLYKTGRFFKDVLVGIGRAIKNVLGGVLLSILFIFRNIWWLLLGAVAGIIYGIYLFSLQGPKYFSETTVKANFGSVRALYTSLDYFNALIRDNRNQELSKLFGLTSEQADKLVYFSASPVKTELVTASMYEDMSRRRPTDPERPTDTFWLRTIKYEEFKESLTEEDYPIHTITVESGDPSVFPYIQNGITAQVATSNSLQLRKQLQASINQDEQKLLTESINNLDSLRRAYNERLVRGQGTVPGANQLTVVEGMSSAKAPELQLYDKLLQLKNELTDARTRSATEKEILEVLSPLNPAGKKETFVESIWIYVATGIGLALAVLILVSLRKTMIDYDASRKKLMGGTLRR